MSVASHTGRGWDRGFLVFDLPDLVGGLTTGPSQFLPYAHNHRVAARTASGYTVGRKPHVHTSRHRVPATVLAFDRASKAAELIASAGDVLERPADAAEGLQWREDVGPPVDVDTSTLRLAGGSAWELARIDLPTWAGSVVERLATYLRVQALDRSGQPVGPVIDTCCDPFPVFVHPVDLSVLTITWALSASDVTYPSLIPGSPAGHVPNVAIQIESRWPDQRYNWGDRYTTGLQMLVPSGATSVRLFVIIAAPGRWSVRVGGRLATWTIPGGPRCRAALAMSSRAGRG